jgi:hypothetical protein
MRKKKRNEEISQVMEEKGRENLTGKKGRGSLVVPRATPAGKRGKGKISWWEKDKDYIFMIIYVRI